MGVWFWSCRGCRRVFPPRGEPEGAGLGIWDAWLALPGAVAVQGLAAADRAHRGVLSAMFRPVVILTQRGGSSCGAAGWCHSLGSGARNGFIPSGRGLAFTQGRGDAGDAWMGSGSNTGSDRVGLRSDAAGARDHDCSGVRSHSFGKTAPGAFTSMPPARAMKVPNCLSTETGGHSLWSIAKVTTASDHHQGRTTPSRLHSVISDRVSRRTASLILVSYRLMRGDASQWNVIHPLPLRRRCRQLQARSVRNNPTGTRQAFTPVRKLMRKRGKYGDTLTLLGPSPG